jgi:hypothetical protein
MIKTLKTSLDFDAMLMLHFNGKPFVQAYDWKKDLEKYEEHDKILHEKASAFNRLVNQQGKTRSAWTEYSILERLGWLNYNIEVFNNGDHLIAPDIASLKKQVAEHIVGLMIAGKELHNDPEPPSINIIEEFIERMFKDGILELAVTFRLDVNKANALKAERNRVVGAETGYILDSFNDLVRLAANKGTK